MTEIILISEIHKEKDNYNSNHLFEILKSSNPDVILLERDSTFYSNGKLDFNKCNESLVTKTLKRYFQIKIIETKPFDIEGRNTFYQKHNFFQNWAEFSKVIENFYNCNKMSSQDSEIYETLIYLSKLQQNALTESPRIINSDLFNKVTELRNCFMYEKQLEIVNKYEELEKYRDFWQLVCDEWIRRNDAMVQNIKKYTIELSGQRIVVIVGAAHKYYLQKGLKIGNSNYRLKEYWEINN